MDAVSSVPPRPSCPRWSELPACASPRVTFDGVCPSCRLTTSTTPPPVDSPFDQRALCERACAATGRHCCVSRLQCCRAGEDATTTAAGGSTTTPESTRTYPTFTLPSEPVRVPRGPPCPRFGTSGSNATHICACFGTEMMCTARRTTKRSTLDDGESGGDGAPSASYEEARRAFETLARQHAATAAARLATYCARRALEKATSTLPELPDLPNVRKRSTAADALLASHLNRTDFCALLQSRVDDAARCAAAPDVCSRASQLLASTCAETNVGTDAAHDALRRAADARRRAAAAANATAVAADVAERLADHPALARCLAAIRARDENAHAVCADAREAYAAAAAARGFNASRACVRRARAVRRVRHRLCSVLEDAEDDGLLDANVSVRVEAARAAVRARVAARIAGHCATPSDATACVCEHFGNGSDFFNVDVEDVSDAVVLPNVSATCVLVRHRLYVARLVGAWRDAVGACEARTKRAGEGDLGLLVDAALADDADVVSTETVEEENGAGADAVVVGSDEALSGDAAVDASSSSDESPASRRGPSAIVIALVVVLVLVLVAAVGLAALFVSRRQAAAAAADSSRGGGGRELSRRSSRAVRRGDSELRSSRGHVRRSASGRRTGY